MLNYIINRINIAAINLLGSRSPDAHPGSDLLLEDGSYLLQEDGVSTFLLE
jgi:hypothetical protein